jgi:hypothetical protein
MALLRCLAEMRDDIRNELGITVPSSFPQSDPRWGSPGAQPPWALQPDNPSINRALNDMVDIVNNKTGYHGTTLYLPIPAQTQQGYLQIPLDMSQFIPAVAPNLGIGNLNTVRRVLWDNGTYNTGGPTNWTQVLATDAIYFDRNQSIQDNAPGGTPQYYFLRDGQLFITPANSIAGYFQIGGGTGSLSLEADTGYIDQIPSGYHQYLRRGAAQLLALHDSGADLESRELLQMLAPFVQDGIQQICDWYTQFQSEATTNTLGIFNLRRSYGTRRRK